MKTKIFTFLLVISSSIGMLQAEILSGTCGENLTWRLNTDSGSLTIDGYGPMDNWKISSWSMVPTPWYNYRSIITSISISNEVTTIGNSAFDGCSGLTEITIPEGIKKIGDYVIDNCPNLRTIYWNAISCDSLGSGPNNVNVFRTVVFGDRVKKIPPYFASGFCGEVDDLDEYQDMGAIKKVIFNDSIEEIGDYAFENCDSLKHELKLPKHLKILGDLCFYKCDSITSCILPEELIEIGRNVFTSCDNLKWSCLNIPNSVEIIRYNAFPSDSYDSLRIGESVKKISARAFPSNDSLKYVEYNAIDAEWLAYDNSNSRGYFLGCDSIKKVVIGNKVKTIPDYFMATKYSNGLHYSDCPIKEIVLPNSVTKVGNEAFAGMSQLNNIYFSENLDSVLSYSFYNTGDENKDFTLIIPSSIRYIGKSAFMKRVSISNQGYYNNINAIPDSVRYIGEYAFGGCRIPTDTLFLPQYVDTIWSRAFEYTSIYKVIKIFSHEPPYLQMNNNSNPVFLNQNTIEVYVPKTSYNLYKSADIWKNMNIKTFEEPSTPTAVDDISIESEKSTKLLRGGQILILRGDKTYTLTGQEVK